MWELMKAADIMLGSVPGGPMTTTACIADYLEPEQRIMVTLNSDTLQGAKS